MTVNMLPFLSLLFLQFQGGLSIRCYTDLTGPNSAGGIEHCDGDSVCSAARIIFREDGVLRKAMSRKCVTRTPDRAESDWPWCSEEWAGGDEGGMEVLTCFCNRDFCNDNNFLRGKFNEWTATTMARLKAGPTHILDIVISLATGAVVLFFIALVFVNLPWSPFSRKSSDQKEDDTEDEEDEEADGEDSLSQDNADVEQESSGREKED